MVKRRLLKVDLDELRSEGWTVWDVASGNVLSDSDQTELAEALGIPEGSMSEAEVAKRVDELPAAHCGYGEARPLEDEMNWGTIRAMYLWDPETQYGIRTMSDDCTGEAFDAHFTSLDGTLENLIHTDLDSHYLDYSDIEWDVDVGVNESARTSSKKGRKKKPNAR